MNPNVPTFLRKSAVVLLTFYCAGCGPSSTQQDLDRLQARTDEFAQLPANEQLTDQ